jgi:hypothetical protein
MKAASRIEPYAREHFNLHQPVIASTIVGWIASMPDRLVRFHNQGMQSEATLAANFDSQPNNA